MMYRLYGPPRTGTKFIHTVLENSFNIKIDNNNKHNIPKYYNGMLFFTIRHPYNFYESFKNMQGETEKSLEKAIKWYNELVQDNNERSVVKYEDMRDQFKDYIDYIAFKIGLQVVEYYKPPKISDNNDLEESEKIDITEKEKKILDKNIDWRFYNLNPEKGTQ